MSYPGEFLLMAPPRMFLSEKKNSTTVKMHKNGWNLYSMLGLNGKPNTVFDVGVAFGTPELYSSFPLSNFVLVEPLNVYKEGIEAILTKIHGTWISGVAGDADGPVQFYQHKTSPMISRPAGDDIVANHNYQQITTRSYKIDTLVEILNLDPPFVLKTDTEGADLRVLSGAATTLQHTDFVISEARTDRAGTHGDATDIICFMKEHRFRLVSINEAKWNHRYRLRWANMIFCKQTLLEDNMKPF